jgi:hypothetical protein
MIRILVPFQTRISTVLKRLLGLDWVTAFTTDGGGGGSFSMGGFSLLGSNCPAVPAIGIPMSRRHNQS